MARQERQLILAVENGMFDAIGTTFRITTTTIEAEQHPPDEATRAATETEIEKVIDHPGTTVVVEAEVHEEIDRRTMEDHRVER